MGWQAVERTAPDGGAKLIVGHVYEGAPRRMEIPVKSGYAIDAIFAEDPARVALSGGSLVFELGPDEAFAALLKRA